MKVMVTLSANAGVAIHMEEYRIWVDALHTVKQPGFSSVDVSLQKRMLQCDAFQKPDFIVCTHCHPDHYSEPLIRAAKGLWPNSRVLLPEACIEDQMLIGEREATYKLEDLTLRFLRLPHDGEQYVDCIHYGLLISLRGKTLLIPGDCKTGAEELAEKIGRTKIDLALLNFPWLTLKRGQAFVKDIMKPGQIILYHLPFAEDDCFGYRDAAKKSAHKDECSEVTLLMEPLQRIELYI